MFIDALGDLLIVTVSHSEKGSVGRAGEKVM